MLDTNFRSEVPVWNKDTNSVQVVLDTNFRSEVPVWNKDTNRGNIGLSIWINYGLMRCFCGTGFTEFYLLRPLCTALKIKTFQLRSKNFHVKIEIPQRKNNDCIFRSLVICDLTYNTGLYCIFVLLPTFFAQVFGVFIYIAGFTIEPPEYPKILVRTSMWWA